MASTALYRATDATADSGYTSIFTWSAWVKRSGLGEQGLCMNKRSDGPTNSRWRFYFGSDDTLNFEIKDSGGSDDAYLRTNRKFRDTSGWYHLVLVYDTTASENDRVKMYVNGLSVETNGGWDEADRASSNFGSLWSSAAEHYVGKMVNNSNTSFYFDGLMSHIHCAYGTAYQASTFGETDATTGEWKIKTSPTVTYGSQGYFILKDGNSTTDQSGEGNNMPVDGGTLTATEDCPSNVFATLSPNLLKSSNGTISNGNLKLSVSGAEWNSQISTFGVSKGKFYFEYRINDNGGDRRARWGMVKESVIMNTVAGQVLCSANLPAINFKTNGESSTYGGYGIDTTESNLVSDGDINSDNAVYGFGIDMDNLKMYGSYNGTWLNSGNPSTGTNGIDISSYITAGTTVFPAFTAHTSNVECNFGNGYFGTTAITDEGVNAAGIGKFEYDVPTGFTALCTKGLNE